MSGVLLSPGTVPRRKLLLSQAGLCGVFRIYCGFPWLQDLKTRRGGPTHQNSSFHGSGSQHSESGCELGRLPLQALGARGGSVCLF